MTAFVVFKYPRHFKEQNPIGVDGDHGFEGTGRTFSCRLSDFFQLFAKSAESFCPLVKGHILFRDMTA